MNAARQQAEPGALELIEEGLHLLRSIPALAWSAYYLGALPFVAGWLFFWAEMSGAAGAYERCAQRALELSLLFLWMKVWQSVFSGMVYACRAVQPPPRWTVQHLVQTAAHQSLLQATGLFLLPLAALLTLPFAWVYAFYQNITVLGFQEHQGLRDFCRNASRHATLWPKQNHLVLLFLAGFDLVVLANLFSAATLGPMAVKTFLGIESTFSRSVSSFLNTTFLMAVLALAYLCLDPLHKTVYLLRCFYGNSRHSGEDLQVDLNQLQSSKTASLLITALVILGCFAPLMPVAAAPVSTVTTVPPPVVQAQELDRSIEQVLAQPEFRWRAPRNPGDHRVEPKGWFALFVDGILQSIQNGLMKVGSWIRNALDWLLDKFRSGSPHDPGFQQSRLDAGSGARLWLFVLLGLIACALTLLLYRLWINRQKTPWQVTAQSVAAVPDLTDEYLAADQLPETGWLALAQTCLAQGELRLALRAFYLASLAHLAHRELILLARHKSNRDYEHELQRRARALPHLVNAFSHNGFIFDCVWYGQHPVTPEFFQQFNANQETIRAT